MLPTLGNTSPPNLPTTSDHHHNATLRFLDMMGDHELDDDGDDDYHQHVVCTQQQRHSNQKNPHNKSSHTELLSHSIVCGTAHVGDGVITSQVTDDSDVRQKTTNTTTQPNDNKQQYLLETFTSEHHTSLTPHPHLRYPTGVFPTPLHPTPHLVLDYLRAQRVAEHCYYTAPTSILSTHYQHNHPHRQHLIKWTYNARTEFNLSLDIVERAVLFQDVLLATDLRHQRFHFHILNRLLSLICLHLAATFSGQDTLVLCDLQQFFNLSIDRRYFTQLTHRIAQELNYSATAPTIMTTLPTMELCGGLFTSDVLHSGAPVGKVQIDFFHTAIMFFAEVYIFYKTTYYPPSIASLAIILAARRMVGCRETWNVELSWLVEVEMVPNALKCCEMLYTIFSRWYPDFPPCSDLLGDMSNILLYVPKDDLMLDGVDVGEKQAL